MVDKVTTPKQVDQKKVDTLQKKIAKLQARLDYLKLQLEGERGV